jgi:hypothetical protein
MAVANIVKTSLGPVGLDKVRNGDAQALTLPERAGKNRRGDARVGCGTRTDEMNGYGA